MRGHSATNNNTYKHKQNNNKNQQKIKINDLLKLPISANISLIVEWKKIKTIDDNDTHNVISNKNELWRLNVT